MSLSHQLSLDPRVANLSTCQEPMVSPLVPAADIGNSNNLPLMVIATMCDNPNSVGGQLGSACQQTGLAYVSFGSCASMHATRIVACASAQCCAQLTTYAVKLAMRRFT